MSGTSRRDFLRTAAAAGVVAGLPLSAPVLGRPAASGKRLLVLGGTRFLGPALVTAARAEGYHVTTFTRGRTRPELFAEDDGVEMLFGDRDGDLESLKGKQWDACVDTSGYVPRIVREAAEVLKGNVGHYTFISSISAFASFDQPGMDETAPVGRMEDPTVEEMGPQFQNYGPLKALCEEEAEKHFPGRTLNIRPGYIVGPEDPSGRFTYWPVRVSRGGEMIGPGTPDDPIQIIDVQDLSDWTIRMVSAGKTGVYNATGPAKGATISEMIEACKKGVGADPKVTWVEAAFLREHEAALPIWVPPEGEYAGFAKVSIQKALNDGLRFRPMDDTARRTLAWWKDVPEDAREKRLAAMPAEKEAEVLAAWKAAHPEG